MWSIFLAPFGGMMVDPATGDVALDSPGTVASLEYIRDLWQHGPVGVESFSFPEAWDAFMLGRAAIMIEASAAAPEVENPDKSLVAGMTGYSPLPAGPAGAFSGVWGWSYAMMDDSMNKEATWAFIAYLTSEGLQADYLANGGIVSRASAHRAIPICKRRTPTTRRLLATLGTSCGCFRRARLERRAAYAEMEPGQRDHGH